MTNHNPLFTSQDMQNSAIAANIKIVKTINSNVFDAKEDFIDWLFSLNALLMPEYVERVVDYAGDNRQFQLSIYRLKNWFNEVEEDDDCAEMLEMYREDIESLLKFCEENNIDYIIES